MEKEAEKQGVITGKRKFKLATQRNYWKRLQREAYRKKKENLKNIHLIVSVNRKCNQLSAQEASKVIGKQWDKLIDTVKASQEQ